MAGKRKSLSGGEQLPSDIPASSGTTASGKKVNRRSSTPTPGKPGSEPVNLNDKVDAAEQRKRAIEWAQRLESISIGGESVVKKSPGPKKAAKKTATTEVSSEVTAPLAVTVSPATKAVTKKAPRKSIGSSSEATTTPISGEKQTKVRKPKVVKEALVSQTLVTIPSASVASQLIDNASTTVTSSSSECTPACHAAQSRGFAPSTALRIVWTPVLLAILVALYLHYPKLFYVAVAAILFFSIMRRITCALLVVPAPLANLQPPPPAV